jgi:hypothetical protein
LDISAVILAGGSSVGFEEDKDLMGQMVSLRMLAIWGCMLITVKYFSKLFGF